jgi:hypothetical protein
MRNLDDAVQRLLAFLHARGRPPSRDVLLIEFDERPALDGTGRRRISRQQFKSPSEYADRFDEVLEMGYAWVNLSCHGVFEGRLVVGIELPAHPSANRRRTSVNYSGPSAAVIANGWSLSEVMVVLD